MAADQTPSQKIVILRDFLNAAALKNLVMETSRNPVLSPAPVYLAVIDGLAVALAILTGYSAKSFKDAAFARAKELYEETDQAWRDEIEVYETLRKRYMSS